MSKYGGKTNRSMSRVTRARKPQRVVASVPEDAKSTMAGDFSPVLVTGRTTPKGDRSGLRAKGPRDIHLGKRKDNSIHTIEPEGSRDPETGRILGVKIAPCRGCGHVRRVQVATGLCGVRSCRSMRQRRYQKRTLAKRATDWREMKEAAS